MLPTCSTISMSFLMGDSFIMFGNVGKVTRKRHFIAFPSLACEGIRNKIYTHMDEGCKLEIWIKLRIYRLIGTNSLFPFLDFVSIEI